jgi:hypothetical protein
MRRRARGGTWLSRPLLRLMCRVAGHRFSIQEVIGSRGIGHFCDRCGRTVWLGSRPGRSTEARCSSEGALARVRLRTRGPLLIRILGRRRIRHDEISPWSGRPRAGFAVRSDAPICIPKLSSPVLEIEPVADEPSPISGQRSFVKLEAST